jgi:sugar lactone lactonase YvrE
MHGSLALARGTLFVGTSAKTAEVRAFDLGGRPLGPAFSFRDARVGRSAAAGLALDDDRSLWVADTPADRVRRFTLFGREVGGLGASAAEPAAERVLPGLIVRPVDVEVQGDGDHGWLAVACAGEQRHAVQLFTPELTWRASLAALGEPGRAFRGVRRLAAMGARLYVAEGDGCRVQVFRDQAFLFAFQLTTRSGAAFEPSALAPLADGRLVVACRAPESALFLVDSAGRVLRVLARGGDGADSAQEGAVEDPCDAVLEPGVDDRHARLFVLDRDGLRLQAFTLDGRCLGRVPLGAQRAPRTKPRRAAREREEGGR